MAAKGEDLELPRIDQVTAEVASSAIATMAREAAALTAQISGEVLLMRHAP